MELTDQQHRTRAAILADMTAGRIGAKECFRLLRELMHGPDCDKDRPQPTQEATEAAPDAVDAGFSAFLATQAERRKTQMEAF